MYRALIRVLLESYMDQAVNTLVNLRAVKDAFHPY